MDVASQCLFALRSSDALTKLILKAIRNHRAMIFQYLLVIKNARGEHKFLCIRQNGSLDDSF